MNKTLILFSLSILFTWACQNNRPKEKKSPGQQNQEQIKKNIFYPESIRLQWTAYKTTGKVPVSGSFKKVEWKNLHPGESPGEMIENLQFKINSASVFTDNPQRDRTIYEYLFGKMLEGNYIEGRVANINPQKKTIRIIIRMNGLEKPVDFIYSTNDSLLHAISNIDLVKDFRSGEALYFLHTACLDKHTGQDGISKTWPGVKLEAFVKFKKNDE